MFRIIIGAIFIAIAFWWGMPSGEVSHGPKVEWQSYSDTLLEEAAVAGKPVIIDFYADWCIPCKELDKISFADNRVIEISKNFVTLKSNLTRGSDPIVKELRSKYDVKGVPTIVFLDQSGVELKNLRIVQFEDADEVLSRFEKLKNTIN
jgi:thiol:disulfide interchange protein DsbD